MQHRESVQWSQDALDKLYNNRLQLPGGQFEAFIERCKNRSADARREMSCEIDVQYGTHPDERLDIFFGKGGVSAPVNVFFHGGYWRASTKEDFSYISYGAACDDVVTVVVNYSLIPAVRMGDLINQCRRSVIWTLDNITKYCGDRSRIYLSGHSAGAHIVAMLMSTNWRHFGVEIPNDWLKGACAISGIYDLAPVKQTFLNRTLGLTDEDVQQFSPVILEPTVSCRLLCAVGEAESSEFIRQTRDFAQKWSAKGIDVDLRIVADRDHFAIREDLGYPDSPMSRMLRKHICASVGGN